MKQRKIKLEKFKVKSFVTTMSNDRVGTIKGGETAATQCGTCGPSCNTPVTVTTTTIDTTNPDCMRGGENTDLACAP